MTVIVLEQTLNVRVLVFVRVMSGMTDFIRSQYTSTDPFPFPYLFAVTHTHLRFHLRGTILESSTFYLSCLLFFYQLSVWFVCGNWE